MRGLLLLPLWAATLLRSSLVTAAQTKPSLKAHRKVSAIIGANGDTTVASKKRAAAPAAHSSSVRAVPKPPARKAGSRVKASPRASPNKRSTSQDLKYKTDHKRTSPVKAPRLVQPAAAARKTRPMTNMQYQARHNQAKAARKRATAIQNAALALKRAAASPQKRMVTAPVKAPRKRKAPANPTRDANKRSSRKKPLSMLEATRIMFAKKRAADHARITSARNVPANVVGADGQELPIQNNAAFVKEFTIQFKVKFANFTRNGFPATQMLVQTEKHALTIQALGDKIGAYMRTESGLGPQGHGVSGSDGRGQLFSHTLAANQWYDVMLQKTPTMLSLSIDGVKASSTIDPHVIIQSTDFDLEADSTKLVAGEMAGSGDLGLNGQMGDLEMIEGPLTVAATNATR